MRLRRNDQGGFTLIEVMIAMVVMVIGLTGVIMMQSAAVRGNRQSAQYSRAALLAEERMEQLRGETVAQLQAGAPIAFTTTFVDKSVTYTTTYTVITPLSGNPNLAQIKVTTSYAENGDTTDLHVATVEMIRTTLENM